MSTADSQISAPTGNALVICDNVYVDSGGKRTLVGLFNQISASRFPAVHDRLCVFVSLTSVRPQTAYKLEVVQAETDQSIIMMEGLQPKDNPTIICDMVFELKGLQFPDPGMYYIRFYGNNIILMQRPLEVLKTTPRSLEQDNDGED